MRSPEHGTEGELTLRVESGDEHVKAEVWQSVLHVSAGWDPYALVDRGEQHGGAHACGSAHLGRTALWLVHHQRGPSLLWGRPHRAFVRVACRRGGGGAPVGRRGAAVDQEAAALAGRVWVVHLGRLLLERVGQGHPGVCVMGGGGSGKV